MDTLLLDRDPWDLCLDAFGNIAMAAAPYAVMQDVASAARLFVGELYYGPPTRGIPYRAEAIGRPYPTPLLKARITAAALAVPGVTAARTFLTSVTDRAIGGQIQIETTSGPATVNF